MRKIKFVKWNLYRTKSISGTGYNLYYMPYSVNGFNELYSKSGFYQYKFSFNGSDDYIKSNAGQSKWHSRSGKTFK